jgi:hypothetical protein
VQSTFRAASSTAVDQLEELPLPSELVPVEHWEIMTRKRFLPGRPCVLIGATRVAQASPGVLRRRGRSLGLGQRGEDGARVHLVPGFGLPADGVRHIAPRTGGATGGRAWGPLGGRVPGIWPTRVRRGSISPAGPRSSVCRLCILYNIRNTMERRVNEEFKTPVRQSVEPHMSRKTSRPL